MIYCSCSSGYNFRINRTFLIIAMISGCGFRYSSNWSLAIVCLISNTLYLKFLKDSNSLKVSSMVESMFCLAIRRKLSIYVLICFEYIVLSHSLPEINLILSLFLLRVLITLVTHNIFWMLGGTLSLSESSASLKDCRLLLYLRMSSLICPLILETSSALNSSISFLIRALSKSW